MLCALSLVAFGVYPYGIMYKACEYRCPREKSETYYYYPVTIRLPTDISCPLYYRVDDD